MIDPNKISWTMAKARKLLRLGTETTYQDSKQLSNLLVMNASTFWKNAMVEDLLCLRLKTWNYLTQLTCRVGRDMVLHLLIWTHLSIMLILAT